MLKIAVVAVLLALANASFEADWAVFKSKHSKVYSQDEEFLRRYIYKNNMQFIKEHNELYAQGKSSYFLGENQFADWTNEEFNRKMNTMNLTVDVQPIFGLNQRRVNANDSVDWRTKGYVTPVKNQGQCGSCWAFSTTGSVEGQHFKSSGKLVSLSESNLVDCSGSFGNQGCDGGLMDNAFKYIKSNGGIDTEESYPYKPEDRRCAFDKANVGATISGFKDVERGSESSLQEAVASVGPVSVAIDASHMSFQFYRGGVYNERRCSTTRLDHGVLVVGYGSQDGDDYWIVKNSWAASWGKEGYIWMSRNKRNQCGIATAASYPTV